jgi:Flp pilus assembly protein TadD
MPVARTLTASAVVVLALSIASSCSTQLAPRFTAFRLQLRAVSSEPEQGERALTTAGLNELRRNVLIAPYHREHRFQLVRALLAARKLEEAEEVARRWRAQDAYNLVAVRTLGDIYMRLRDAKRAERTYSAVVELVPGDIEAQHALAMVLLQARDLKTAYERLLKVEELAGADQRIAFEIADLAQRLGKTKEAIARFDRIIAAPDIDPALSYPARQRLANLYAAQRREALRRGETGDARRWGRRMEEIELPGGAENAIKIYLSWDADKTDVDLWVETPAKETIKYDNPRGRSSEELFRDVTTGYGPESFRAPTASPGVYTVRVHYFDTRRPAFPEVTGEVTVVLNEGTEQEQVHVLPYRLFSAGQVVTVAQIHAS